MILRCAQDDRKGDQDDKKGAPDDRKDNLKDRKDNLKNKIEHSEGLKGRYNEQIDDLTV